MFKTIVNFFKNLFSKNSLSKFIEAAVKTVDVIKQAVDNPLLDVSVALTKTKIDDIILAKVRKVLPVITEQLLRQHHKLKSNERSLSEKDLINMLVNLLIEYQNSKEEKTNLLTALAANLLKEITDGTIDFYEAKEKTQAFYDELKRTK